MSITAVKTIKFEDLMKIFKKFVATSEVRPVLQLVHFDGVHFTGTDSHRMLRVNAEYVSDIPESITIGTLYNPKKMEVSNYTGNYPETNRLIPNHCESWVTFSNNSSLNELHKQIKEAKKVSSKQKNNVVKFQFNNNSVTIDSYDPETEKSYNSTIDSVRSNEKEFKFAASGKYMDEALMVIKKLSKLSNNSVNMNFISHNRPIYFGQEGVFDIVVLPVRLY